MYRPEIEDCVWNWVWKALGVGRENIKFDKNDYPCSNFLSTWHEVAGNGNSMPISKLGGCSMVPTRGGIKDSE
jgi:hypothetical protein